MLLWRITFGVNRIFRALRRFGLGPDAPQYGALLNHGEGLDHGGIVRGEASDAVTEALP